MPKNHKDLIDAINKPIKDSNQVRPPDPYENRPDRTPGAKPPEDNWFLPPIPEDGSWAVPGDTQGNPYSDPSFNPTIPAPELLSLDEMIDIINRRTELATQPRLDGLERQREAMQLQGQQRLGEVGSAYERARQDMFGDINKAQQQTSQTMQRRGIYDSGLAAKLAHQVQRKGLEMGLTLGEEQARQMADIAEYIHLETKHNFDEIQSIMGEKAMMAHTLLDEMRLEQQRRGDDLAQREFENWLAQQAHQLDEYWRQETFDAGRADQEWQKWFNEEQLRVQMEQAEWERVFNMNKWEAEHELQSMLANHQISQAEFNNALALDELELKRWLYQTQNTPSTSKTVVHGTGSSGQESGMWWDLNSG